MGSILNKNIINHSNFKKNESRENFSILILGGSQGAKIFGEVIPSVVKMLKDEGHTIEINQQCTKNQKNSIIDYYKINALWYKCDITNYSDVYKVFKQVIAELGRIDILINNAAIDSKVEDRDTEKNTSRFENFDLNNQNVYNAT